MVNYAGTYAVPRPDLGAAYNEFMDDPAMSQFIAPQVAPDLPTPVQSGTHSVITRESALSLSDPRRAEQGGYNRVSMGAEDHSFSCKEYGLEAPVDDRKRKFYANDFDHKAAALRQVIRKLKMHREIRTKDLVFNPTVWTGAALTTDVSGSAPWSTLTSNLAKAVGDAREKGRQGCGMDFNALIMGRGVLEQFVLPNEKILARFNGFSGAVTEDVIRKNVREIFGVERLIVGGGVYNSANEGKDFTGADIWGTTHVMVARVCNPGAPIDEPSVARSYRWTAENAEDLLVEEYRSEPQRADILRVRHDIDENLIDKFLGHLIKIT